MGKNYWMVVITPQEFEKLKGIGFSMFGMKSKFRRRAERMQPNDRILIYVSRTKKWPATATVKSRFFESKEALWNLDEDGDDGRDYIYRVNLSPDIILQPDDYIDAMILGPRLEYVKRWVPEDWPLAFLDSLHLLPQRDFNLIEEEMERIKGSRKKSSARRSPHAEYSNNHQAFEEEEPTDESEDSEEP